MLSHKYKVLLTIRFQCGIDDYVEKNLVNQLFYFLIHFLKILNTSECENYMACESQK